MYTLGIAAVGIGILVLGWGGYFFWRYIDRRQRRLAEWESSVVTIGPTTLIGVHKLYRTNLTRRVFATKVMTAITDTEKGWGDKLAAAVIEADMRATELNARDM
jgi:heme/copper-type cytochrome/quinol oxidase subunit 2